MGGDERAKSNHDIRRDRLSALLRENLKRRKAQERRRTARATSAVAEGDAPAAPDRKR